MFARTNFLSLFILLWNCSLFDCKGLVVPPFPPPSCLKLYLKWLLLKTSNLSFHIYVLWGRNIRYCASEIGVYLCVLEALKLLTSHRNIIHYSFVVAVSTDNPSIYQYLYVKTLEGYYESTSLLNMHSMNTGNPWIIIWENKHATT